MSYQPFVEAVGEMSKISDVKEVRKSASTDRIMFCIAGIFKDLKLKKDRIYHFFAPKTLKKYHGHEEQQNLLASVLTVLAKRRKTKGLVVGGYAESIKYKDKQGQIVSTSEMSLDMLNFLKKPFKQKIKKNKADFSCFLFQKYWHLKFPSRPVSAFLYDKANDTYYISCLIEKNDKSFINVLKKSDIRNHFRFIHVSDNDKVFIGLNNKKHIKNDYWNSSNVKFKQSKQKSQLSVIGKTK